MEKSIENRKKGSCVFQQCLFCKSVFEQSELNKHYLTCYGNPANKSCYHCKNFAHIIHFLDEPTRNTMGIVEFEDYEGKTRTCYFEFMKNMSECSKGLITNFGNPCSDSIFMDANFNSVPRNCEGFELRTSKDIATKSIYVEEVITRRIKT